MSRLPTLATLVRVLRLNPQWTVLQLSTLDEELLGRVRLADLFAVDQRRLTRTKRLRGEAYDAVVLEIVREARGPVSLAHVRERVQGSTSKLQHSLRRLTSAGKLIHEGRSTRSRYTIAPGELGSPRPLVDEPLVIDERVAK